MKQDNQSFVHDTINLDEIRRLLEGEGEAVAENKEETALPEAEEVVQSSEEASEEEAEELFCEEEPEAEEEEEAEAEPEAEAEISETEETPQAEAVSETEEKSEKKKTSLVYEIYGMLHDVVWLLAAVTLIFVFLVRLVGVEGESMMPTLHNRDFLVLESNFLCSGDDLEYGDIVVLNVPHYESKGDGPIVKRVIATQGQTVDIDFDTGCVYVDGVQLVEDYINEPTRLNWEGEYAFQYPVTVPENCIFVLGDNRNNSMDSRYVPIGMVHEQYVLGKVLLVALPGQTSDSLGNVIDPRDWGRIGPVS